MSLKENLITTSHALGWWGKRKGEGLPTTTPLTTSIGGGGGERESGEGRKIIPQQREKGGGRERGET